MSNSESGVQLLARLGSRPSLAGLEPAIFDQGPKAGSVIEVYGPEGTGKTQLLLHFVAKCILPQKWLTCDLGGLNSKVIFIDTDYKFSILRLVLLLENKITESFKSAKHTKVPSGDDIEAFIVKCLKNLSVVKCNSSQQLLCTLHSLDNSVSTDINVGCVMIDSISAFYWLDRCNHGDNTSGHERRICKIVDILAVFSKKYNILVIATKNAIFKAKVKDLSKGDNSSPFAESLSKGPETVPSSGHVEYLGKDWSKFVEERLILMKEIQGDQTVFKITQKSSTLSVNFSISEGGICFI